MGYTLELGYGERTTHESNYIEVANFEVAKVRPFTGGSIVPLDPELGAINEALEIAPFEYGDELFVNPTEFPLARAVDDRGLVEASIGITFNYTDRIMEITGQHLSEFHGELGAAVVSPLVQLITELKDDPDFDDYWNPTDGNIKHLSKTLLDWVFQHPDAVFRSIG